MRRTGSKKRPYYRVVVTEGREPREGSFLEVLGTYNPRTRPATVEIDQERPVTAEPTAPQA
jgi:small subunit ribosomal protein S16